MHEAIPITLLDQLLRRAPSTGDAMTRLSLWLPIREGDRDSMTVRLIETDFCYAEWESLSGVWGRSTSSDVVPLLFHDPHSLMACPPPCDTPAAGDNLEKFAKIRFMQDMQQSWVAKLYAQGTPATRPMRLSMFTAEFAYPGAKSTQWPLSVPIESVLSPVPIAKAGTSRFIEGTADAQALRNLRSSYLGGELGSTMSQYISIADGEPSDRSYELYMRDAIPPLEDDRGLVPYPSSGARR